MNAPAPSSRDATAELAAWCLRQTGPQWTAADQQAFDAWRAADPARERAYRQWCADWALMQQLPAAAAERLRAQVQRDRAAAARPPAPRRRHWSLGFASGLTLAGLGALLTIGGWLGWQHWQAQPLYEQVATTRPGQQAELKLPDGSLLRLDTATSLKVTYYRQRREVQLLEGQALFAVQPGADRPFSVTAEAVRVTVVGTRFSVRWTPGVPGRAGVEVAVEEGRVRVAPPGDAARGAAPPAPFELIARQAARFQPTAQRYTIGPLPAGGAAPWRGRQLSFSDAPLAQALAEMGRYGALKIGAVDPAVADLRLTGTFDPLDPAGTRKLLAHALPVTLQPGPAGLDVRPAR